MSSRYLNFHELPSKTTCELWHLWTKLCIIKVQEAKLPGGRKWAIKYILWRITNLLICKLISYFGQKLNVSFSNYLKNTNMYMLSFFIICRLFVSTWMRNPGETWQQSRLLLEILSALFSKLMKRATEDDLVAFPYLYMYCSSLHQAKHKPSHSCRVAGLKIPS